jgi:alkylhydroperoxidase/carboxymuconolactone decarboxylase family protein YurZ
MSQSDQNPREQGKAIMRQILGDAFVDNMDRDIANGVLGIFPADHSVESCWATIWGRPGLDMRSRSIATIAMVMALREPVAIRNQIRGGIRLGLSPKEIEEIAYQAIPYLGYPAAGVAIRTLRDTFKEDGLA